ncbi:MAG: hypothetical protein WBG73_04695 [Coleofasciculaceae cyanobacterium]
MKLTLVFKGTMKLIINGSNFGDEFTLQAKQKTCSIFGIYTNQAGFG